TLIVMTRGRVVKSPSGELSPSSLYIVLLVWILLRGSGDDARYVKPASRNPWDPPVASVLLLMATPLPNFVLNAPARRVLAHLRRGPMTVEELAKAMRITPNAVRNQLHKLRAANLLIRTGTRPGASKPSGVYAITIEG